MHANPSRPSPVLCMQLGHASPQSLPPMATLQPRLRRHLIMACHEAHCRPACWPPPLIWLRVRASPRGRFHSTVDHLGCLPHLQGPGRARSVPVRVQSAPMFASLPLPKQAQQPDALRSRRCSAEEQLLVERIASLESARSSGVCTASPPRGFHTPRPQPW